MIPFLPLMVPILHGGGLMPTKTDDSPPISISKQEFAAALKVGQHVIIGTGNYWIWRDGTKHWGRIERIFEFQSNYGNPQRRFLILWDHRKYGVFKSRNWIDYWDIDGMEGDEVWTGN